MTGTEATKEAQKRDTPGSNRSSSAGHAYLISSLTSFLSFRLVTMTMVAVFCSQIILQKSFTVSSFGPKVVNSKDEESTHQGEEICWEIGNIHS